AKKGSMGRRTLGIGVINYAYYLAKNGARYSDGSGLALTHRTFEAIQYYLLKASVQLAREFGPCPLFHETTYAQGILPIDTYKKDLDNLCNEPLHYDWETLRADIQTVGLRNSTLTALMPSETSSQISNATNGIEPPRGLVSVKASKDGILKQVVPEYDRLKDQYELLWKQPSVDGYLQLVGIMQKFVDQAISANTNYDPGRFEGNKVPMKQLLKDLLTAYKYGLKTLYYHNTRDGADDAQADMQDDGCAGGACKI
ncbi:MAG: ribonucleotide-diphosphate reductase subunit alpha, partial [Aeromonas sp.]